jgi:hypothetical protein
MRQGTALSGVETSYTSLSPPGEDIAMQLFLKMWEAIDWKSLFCPTDQIQQPAFVQ